jgi:hypothetical protein
MGGGLCQVNGRLIASLPGFPLAEGGMVLRPEQG